MARYKLEVKLGGILKKHLLIALALLLSLIAPAAPASAWDPQPNNPFPGVAFGAEVPGYSKTIVCSDTPQIPDDCVRSGGGQANCPEWTANDITWTYRSDGSVSSLVSWCRNSWTPPSSAADDEDFRNRQNIAMAEATALSQAWNNAHPGQQKCFQWGPIVHANGISVSSGGVCANPVAAPLGNSSDSQDSTDPVATSTDSRDVRDSNALPAVDLTQFGIGKPFTKVVLGNLTLADCPSGYQAASNPIYGIWNSTGTECWPTAAWAAYSVGGATWTAFKDANISEEDKQAQSLDIQLNRIKALALNQAQQLSNDHIGENVCVPWTYGTLSGSECAYIPFQNGSARDVPVYLASDSVTSDSKQNFAGTVVQLQEAVKSIVDDPKLAQAITSTLNRFAALFKRIIKSGTAIPSDKSFKSIARSNSPAVCSISNSRVLVKKSGVCNIKYTVTYAIDLSGDALDSTNHFVLSGKIKVKK